MKKPIFAVVGLVAVLSLLMASIGCASPSASPSIRTDKPDYQPEEIVTISGTGFSPGPVDLTVTRPDGEIDEIPDVPADSSGSFTATYQLDGILGTYVVNATDSAGQTVQTTFTDTPKVGSVTVGSQTGTLTAGIPGSVTYTITVTRGTGAGSSGSFNVDLIITTALPMEASGSFSPDAVFFVPSVNSMTSTLTITTTGSTPAGISSFTVVAMYKSIDYAEGPGTLTIGGATCIDSDGDGYGEGTGCSGSDCDDSNPNVWVSCASCDDWDNDGWYAGCDDYDTINGPDCDDDNPNVWVSCASCDDWDNDGYYAGCDDYSTINGPDCDDNNPNVWNSCGGCDDWDNDGWYAGCDDYSTINGPDCDDDDPNVWSSCGSCVDNDGDGHYAGCDDYSTINGPDCDDDDPNVWSSCGSCVDNDGDGYYAGCDDYSTINGPDCDDNDPNVWSSCGSCVDNDGDGYYAGCDDYSTINGPDPDDSNPGVPSGQTEIVPPPKTWYVLKTYSTEGGAVTRPRWGVPYLDYFRYAYYAGEVVVLEATPDAGYRFVNWTGDVDTIADVNAASTTIIMNGFYEITANFELET